MKFIKIVLGLALPLTALAQPIGEVDTAGTTWYDLQHVGPCGRMVAVDDEGYAHVAWMKGMTSDVIGPRHVFYNLWDHTTETFIYGGGIQIDNSTRAGFATIGLYSVTCPVIAYRHTVGYYPRVTVSLCGQVSSTPLPNDSDYVHHYYPQMIVDAQGIIHVMSVDEYDPETLISYYCRGVPQFDNDGFPVDVDWQFADGQEVFLPLDTVQIVGYSLSASRNTSRIVLGWSHPRVPVWEGVSQLDNDLILRVSEDGGTNWSGRINVTNFVGADLDCLSGDTLACNRDTFRVYTDCSLLFDENDWIHAAFTVRPWFEFGYPGYIGGGIGWRNQAGVYHWNEQTGNFALIASAFYSPTVNGEEVSNGAFQTNVQRPSLAIDPATNFLYCAYMQYDSNCSSNEEYLIADLFVSVSTDNGAHWSVGTNVTRTCSGENVPAPGSMHERDVTLAETAAGGVLNLTYVLDHDAGSINQNEGVATLNEFIYQRIPVDSIATTPLVPNYPLHYDSTGFVSAREPARAPVVREVELHPAYPNPFNSSTEISFELPARQRVELTVYDLIGRKVVTLVSGTVSAGQQRVRWDAGAAASGLYLIALRTEGALHVQKVILLK